jgi:hypothetical protein
MIYERAFDLPIFPDAKAQAVTAGLKCPPEIFPPNPMAIPRAAIINTGVPVKDIVAIKRAVPRYSTKAGVIIPLILLRMKYLIVKGWLGFGDRLESLKMAVKYALDNNLQIYVDWTDRFIRDKEESFYTYFNLVNMPTLNSLDDIPPDATVYPEYWKDHLKEPFTDELWPKEKEVGLDIGMLNEKKFNADVIVYSCIGKRFFYYDSKFFANVFRVIHPDIIREVSLRQSRYNLGSCVGIHIRGTDRINAKKGRDLPIQYLSLNLFTMARNKQQIVVSDDKLSSDSWKTMNPSSTLLSSLSLQQKGPIHELTGDKLTVSKDSLNIDMLVDFFTLASCSEVFTTYRDSRFAAESVRLHSHVNQILGIYHPPVITVTSPQEPIRQPIVKYSGFKLKNGRFIKMDNQ